MPKMIKRRLLATDREGMDNLVGYLEDTDFFTAPASTKFHGCYKGGLADHSWRVFNMLVQYSGQFDIAPDSIAIAALLHDLCKIRMYTGTKKPYGVNKSKPKGHATISLARIKKFITLEPIEEMMVRYHMGVYGLKEFDAKTGEYHLRSKGLANAWFHHPIVKMMYFCDELATFAEKAVEK